MRKFKNCTSSRPVRIFIKLVYLHSIKDGFEFRKSAQLLTFLNSNKDGFET